MNSITLTVKGISIKKEGTNSNGPWHLYGVEDTNGKKHSTFLEGLVIGETYDFLQEIEPHTSQRDGKTYQSSRLTGFDSKKYEGKGERPIQATPANPVLQSNSIPTDNSFPASAIPKGITSFTDEDRRKLDCIYDYVIERINNS